jgi:hypothetical protein
VSLFDLTQHPVILLMPGIVYAAFDANEAVDIYPIGIGMTIASFDPFLPGCLKFCSADI